MERYFEHNPDTFRDKTVLLPCDDPEWSNFTIYFAQNFERLGLKKLISTSFAVDSKKFNWNTEPTELEQKGDLFDWAKTRARGKVFILERDITGDGKINHSDIEWKYLEGNGDFESEEVRKLRDEADIIVTNPPFSIFRKFWKWVTEADKKFLIIANKSSFSYKEIYPLVKDNKVWSGCRPWSGGMWFICPSEGNAAKAQDESNLKNVAAVWITNLEHGRRHEPLPLMTTADIFKHTRIDELKKQGKFLKYDNYDAIEVNWVETIPSDYDGVVGVPITFLDKYCPEQFEIVGFRKGNDGKDLKVNGVNKYFRILIRKKQ